MSESATHLATINPHPRDASISFEEAEHIYQVGLIIYVSMTTVIHSQYSEFNAQSLIFKSSCIRGISQPFIKP